MRPSIWRSAARRLCIMALPLAAIAALLLPATASAHAILLRSLPTRDAQIAAAPTQIRMWFSEDLNPTFSTAYVVNAADSTADVTTNLKTHVDTGDAHVVVTDSRAIDVSLKPNLPPAVYVVLYRTQSAADGHILRGSWLFTVVAPDGTVPTFKGQLPGQESVGISSTGQLDGPTFFSLLMITLVELGVVFWVGAHFWHTFVVQMMEPKDATQEGIYRATQRRFEQWFAVPVLLLLLVTNIGVLVGDGLNVTGGQWGQALAPSVLIGLVASGQFGTYWIMREVVILVALVLAGYALLFKRRPQWVSNTLSWSNLTLGLALLIAMTLSGHGAATGGGHNHLALDDLLHLLAAALWIGGMMYIAVVYLPILRIRSWVEQTRSLLKMLPAYSVIAIAGVVLMSVTGPVNATGRLSSWDQLLSTAYGRALIVKVLIVGGLLVTSAIHVLLFRPRLAKDYKRYCSVTDTVQGKGTDEPHRSLSVTAHEMKVLEESVAHQTKRLSTTLRWEPLLGVAVLLCTGLMTVLSGTLQPTTTSQSSTPAPVPFNTTVQTTDKQFLVKLSITPNRAGATNTFAVTVLDRKSVPVPKNTVGVSLYTTMLDMDMGSDHINLQPDNAGHFSGSGDLSMGGHWQLRIEIRTLNDQLHGVTVPFVTPS